MIIVKWHLQTLLSALMHESMCTPITDNKYRDEIKLVGFFKKKPMKKSAATRATSEARLFYIFSADFP